MAGIEVREAVVLSCKGFIGMDGQYWKEAQISWSKPEYVPGQYVMVARKVSGERWPSPLMIQGKTREGLVVWIHSTSPLARIQEQEAVTVWGPSGMGLELERDYLLVSDEAGSLLTHPFLENAEGCRGSYILGKTSGIARQKDARVVKVEGIEELVEVWKQNDGIPVSGFSDEVDIIVAVPLAIVDRWKKQMPDSVLARTRIFTGVKVGCGIGACRGCYIHDRNGGQGVPVCQEGPFLPLESIDYERDQNFLMHFIGGGDGR